MSKLDSSNSNINYYILKFMKQTKNTELEDYFDPKNLSFVNKSIKNGNYYAVDRFGIPIRLKDHDSKTVHGWCKFNGEIIHTIVNKSIINLVTDEQIRDQAINELKLKYPNTFKLRTATHKILNNLYGNKYDDQIE